MRRILHIILGGLLLLPLLSAANPGTDIRFRRISINEGLSLSSVYTIFQDSKGFMWFGTEDGLNRFDGQDFRIFRPNIRNENCVSYRWIESMTEDPDQNLWFGSRGGLSRFDPRTEQFTQYIRQGTEGHRLHGDSITCLFSGKEYLWAGQTRGLDRISLETGKVVPLDPLMPAGRINHIVSSDSAEVWICTDMGLYRYVPEEDQLVPVPLGSEHNPVRQVFSMAISGQEMLVGTEQGLFIASHPEGPWTRYGLRSQEPRDGPGFPVMDILPDPSGQLWLVGQDGLFVLNAERSELRMLVRAIDITHSLALTTVKPLFLDDQGTLWFGTFGSGLYRINPKTLAFDQITENTAIASSLSENSINCIYEDDAGLLWFGTFGAGISIYIPQSHQFELIRNNPLDPNSLSDDFVWSMMEDRDGDLWIGTNDRGISVYHPETGQFISYAPDPGRQGSLSNPSIREIYQDRQGRIWIGTDGGGLNLFHPGEQRFTVYRHREDDPASISGNSVRVVYEDSQDRLWVGTRNGLNLFDPVSGRFTRFQHHEDDSSSISNDFVYSSLHEDDNGLLWVCTHGGGLNCLDPETGRFTRYRHHAGDPESIADDIVFCLYEDPDGYFWLGTNNGLDRFDPNTGKSRRFGLEAGLPSEVVYSVLPDDQGHIWMSTNNGLCRFSLADHSVLNFDVHDGLQSNEFNGGSYHQGPGGLLYFGGVLGLSVVNPASIQPSPNLARPVITKLFIMGREVSVRPVQSKGENRHILHYDDESGEFYIDRNISFVDHVYLSYRDRFFSLEYAALNSTLQGNTEYSYFMDNLSESWSSTGNRNYVSFAGMRPGTYTFHVRTRNHHGVESPVTASLQITIIPPFWMTTWFHILETLLAAVVAVMVYTYMLKNRTNKLLRKQNEEIARANRQLAESEKRLQELNATKDKFFSIISHDLKNPLSTLLTISDVLVNYRDESGPDHMKQGLQEMHGSLREIHVLLENLLTWSKSQRGKLDFHPVLFNLSNVLQETMNLYRVPASEKDIHLEGAFPEKLQAYGDREMIHTVVRNLVNNAVKFTEKGGRIDLEAALEGNLVIVRVKDSGLGIQASDLERLFRIDEKVKTRGTAGEQGSGLGLILCREFIEKNQGSLHVESQPGKGSIFWFSIPVNGGSS